MAARQTKKRKKRGYKTGTYESVKGNGTIAYRSGWELCVAKYLDSSSQVKSWKYESFFIPYLANPRSKKLKRYYPDFLVELEGGRLLLVEVKRDDKVLTSMVVRKSQAARKWCLENKAEYQIWTSKTIKKIEQEMKNLVLD